MIKNRNYSNHDPAQLPNLPVFEGYNFARTQPDTTGPEPVGVRLWPGDDTPRTFINCNLMNCEVPPGSTVTDCLTVIMETDIPDYDETLVIDGVERARVNFKKVRIHGRYVDGVLERKPAPEELPE
jgi:hypothetical protein